MFIKGWENMQRLHWRSSFKYVKYVCCDKYWLCSIFVLDVYFYVKFLCKISGDIRSHYWVRVIMFNATFNNTAVSFVSTGNRRKPPTCPKSLTNFIALCCMEYTLQWTWFKLTTLVVIGTDCTSSYKSNYHMITTITALYPITWLST